MSTRTTKTSIPSRQHTSDLASTKETKRDKKHPASETNARKPAERSTPKSEKPRKKDSSASESEEEVVDDDYRRNPYKTKFHKIFDVQDKEYIWRYEPEYSDIGRDLCAFSSVEGVPAGDGKKGEKLNFQLHFLVGKGLQHRNCHVEGDVDELFVLLPSGPKVDDKPLYLEPMNKHFSMTCHFNVPEYDLATFEKHHGSGSANMARNLKRTRKDIKDHYYAVKDGKDVKSISIEECVKAFGFGYIDPKQWRYEPKKTSLVKEIAVFTRVQSKDQHRERGATPNTSQTKVYEEYCCVGKETTSRQAESTLFSAERAEIVVLFPRKDRSKDNIVLIPEEVPKPHKIVCQFIMEHYDAAVIVPGDNIYKKAKKGKIDREDIHRSRYFCKDGSRVLKDGSKLGMMVSVPNLFTGGYVNAYKCY